MDSDTSLTRDAADRKPSGEPKTAKSVARRRAILDAAAHLFIEKGYGATSLGDVVKRSGGSLSTLYEMFGNKAGLFKAIIAERCAHASAALEADGIGERPVDEALMDFARGLFGLVMSSDAIAVVRLIVAEGGQFPDLAPMFFASGPEMTAQRLSAYLSELDARGELDVPDPVLATRQLTELIKGEYFFCAVLGLPVTLTPADVEAHLRGAVGTFLRAHRPH